MGEWGQQAGGLRRLPGRGTFPNSVLHLAPATYSNAVSYSDGPRGNSTGRLLFYLTSMDATAQDLAASPAATLTVCEAQLPGGCEGTDPEDPTCVKLALSGELRPVEKDGLEEARELLFARHPVMRSWPEGHAFQIHELALRTLRLLDWYGGAQDIAPADFLAASLGGEGGRQVLSLQRRPVLGSQDKLDS